MTGRRFGFHTVTLGCKLNRFDTAALEGELARRGYPAEDDPSRAAIVIVNTCSVTHRADAEARKLVRRLRRGNPDCALVVTGCYAERDGAALAALDGIDRAFGNRDKSRFGAILDELGFPALPVAPGGPPQSDRGCDGALPEALHFGNHSRAFLKIQDGCRLACSYCIIPTVRGPSRSVSAVDIEAAVARLEREAFGEIVLTGINTGDWGRDLSPRSNLATLLRRLVEVPRRARLRLNSLEPLTVTDEVIELIAAHARLAPHLQIPLQAGSDRVLRAMRRNYRAHQWLERVERLRDRVPRAGIGADVIVGFPGETDAEFEATAALLARSPVDYLHVFSWSPRPGTPAADLGDRVPGPTIEERSTRLRRFSEGRKEAQRERSGGESVEVVLLNTGGNPRRTRALTDNYLELSLPPSDLPRGSLQHVRVLSREAGVAAGPRPAAPLT